MSRPLLIIGNKNYSSWSLRPWLALKHAGIEFDELRLPLDTDQFYQTIGQYSPTGRVPVLRVGALTIWDSLAICEYAADLKPDAGLWPEEIGERAWARSVCAEMHSGFESLRSAMPMNCRAHDRQVTPDDNTLADIARIQTLWAECRAHFAERGPWLFGRFTIADAFYAPVAMRFRTYGITLDDTAAAYINTLLADPVMKEWLAAAEQESEVLAGEEVGAQII